MYKIFAIDDDAGYLKSLQNFLTYKNFEVVVSTNSVTANEIIRSTSFDCILCDVKMPGIDGLTLLKEIHKITPATPVVMVSGQSNISIAVDAIHKGAYDFIEKAADTDRLLITIKNAIAKKSWSLEKDNLITELSENFEMIGKSPLMLHLFQQIRTVSPTMAKVLILGETGTGKELVARALHLNSQRSGKPFIKVNCAAIPETLLESELFGHKKGSFTGAIHDKQGKFQAADGGTLFLDEIGDLSPLLQAKLLRVLQDNEIEIIGDNFPRQVDVRIIAATNQPLEKMVEEGMFREDLYHRIKVITLQIPPLRTRKKDIPMLTHYFLRKNADTYNKLLTDITPAALALLMEKEWRGNVRELKNIMEKICIFSNGSVINAVDVQRALSKIESGETHTNNKVSLKDKLEQYEQQYIRQVLDIHDNKIGKTADFLKIDRTTLFKKMQKYNLTRRN